MTENPNIKKAILKNILEENPRGDEDEYMYIGDMPALAKSRGWDLERVVRHVNDMPCLTCGTSPKYPWPWDREKAEDRLQSYR